MPCGSRSVPLVPLVPCGSSASEGCRCGKLVPPLHPFRRFTLLFSRLRSRSLSELTRQITPPTKNDHAPPPIESRKSLNLSILTMSGPGEFPRVVKLSRRLHSWWCPSVNFFKFQPCDHTPPRVHELLVSHRVLQGSYSNTLKSSGDIVYSLDYDGI